ncbi:hypothetical protein L931_05720 [Helicobacter pylori PZ5024]|uniref:Uncharacterized protein n=1 Tax=Helicobacter pylori PZ5024 TaxID=1337391 RepID=T2T106_HELPX|nr:hypothetical protein L931_05720 [Helicobacter pylori PZ5024]
MALVKRQFLQCALRGLRGGLQREIVLKYLSL